MTVTRAGLTTLIVLTLRGISTALEFDVLLPLPMDDREEWTDDDRSPRRADGLMKLPQDATRSEWEDESEWLQSRMHRANPTPRPAPPQAPAGPKASAPVQGGLPPPLEASPAAGIDDAAIGQRGTAGAGFGAPCNAHAPCSSALGLACVVSDQGSYHCGCAHETPVFFDEGGMKKCVQAKSVYESCIHNRECSFENPNLQCVDFVCYCPLPFVLTDDHRCITPPSSQKNIVVVIAPATLFIAVVLLIGGGYTYRRRRSSVEGGWPSRSSVSGPRSTRRSSDSTRRVSSAIRLGRKAEASRRLRLSLDEHGAALRDNRVPRHPPRYIKTKPREQSPQRSAPQGSRTSDNKDESLLMSLSGDNTSIRDLPYHFSEGSPKANAKVPRGKQAQKEAGGHQTSPLRQLESKGDLLLKMLNEAEVKVSVERHGSSAFTESKSRSAGRHPRVPFPASTHRPSYWENKAESTGTEDSFMKEVRFRMRATNKQGLAQKGPVSTDVIPSNAGAGGHEDKTTRNVVDKSQQVSDELGGGKKPGVPVHKQTQKSDNQPEQRLKKNAEGIFGSQIVSLKDIKRKEPETSEASTSARIQTFTQSALAKRQNFLRRIFPDAAEDLSIRAAAKKTQGHGDVEEDAKHSVALGVSHVPNENAARTKDEEDTRKDTRKDAGKEKSVMASFSLPGETVDVSDALTSKTPTFKNVLKELIHQRMRKTAVTAKDNEVPQNTAAEKTSLRAAEPTNRSLLVKEDASFTGSIKRRMFRRVTEETKSLSPQTSSRFYTTTIDESKNSPITMGTPQPQTIQDATDKTRSDISKETNSKIIPRRQHELIEKTCSTLKGSLKSAAAAPELAQLLTSQDADDKTSSELSGKTFEKTESHATGLLSLPNGMVDDSRPLDVTRFPKGRGGSDNRKSAQKPADPRPGAKTQGNQSVGHRDKPAQKKFPKSPLRRNVSQSEQILPAEGRIDGYAPPSSPGNSALKPRQPWKQELAAARSESPLVLEQCFRRGWSLASPEAILGSMDVESSESSLGGLRPAFKQSVNMTSRLLTPRGDPKPVLRKNKSKRWKKQVKFQEKPFADVLAEMEADSPCHDGRKQSASDGESGKFSGSGEEDVLNTAVVKTAKTAAPKVGVDESAEPPTRTEDKDVLGAALPRDAQDGTIPRDIALPAKKEASKQEHEVPPDRSAVQRTARQMQEAPARPLSLPPSRTVSLRDAAISRPFCRSDEGTLTLSASTTLSFFSSDSSVNVVNRVTDLTALHALEMLAAPFPEIGDAILQPRVAGISGEPKLSATAQHPSHRQEGTDKNQELAEAPRQHQQQEEPRDKVRPLDQSKDASLPAPEAVDRLARPTLPKHLSEQTRRQGIAKKCSPTRLPKRPNTGERQRTNQSAEREPLFSDGIMRVILMGNQHYLRERSSASALTLPEPCPRIRPLDETQYIAQQIEQAHASCKDATDATAPKPEHALSPPGEGLNNSPVMHSSMSGKERSHDSSSSGIGKKLPPTSGTPKKQVLSLPSRCPAANRLPQNASQGLPCVLALPQPATARQLASLGPSGERKMDTIIEAAYEIRLEHPHAVTGVLGAKSPCPKAGDQVDDDAREVVGNAVQFTAVGDDINNVSPEATTGRGITKSGLTHSSRQWQARELEAPAPVGKLTEVAGSPESFSKFIELPSASDLRMSETPTPPSRLADSAGRRASLDPSSSTLSYDRTDSVRDAHGRRLSTRMREDPCFESLYNSILQSPPGTPASVFGSTDFSRPFEVRESVSGFAPRHSTSAPRTENYKRKDDAPHETGVAERQPVLRFETSSPTGSRPNATRPLIAGLPRHDLVATRPQPPRTGDHTGLGFQGGDKGNDEEDNSSFLSFEESASETSLLPDAADLDWSSPSSGPA